MSAITDFIFDAEMGADNEWKRLFVSAAIRLCAILFFQTLFNYAFLLYGIHTPLLSGNEYTGVIVREYYLRSQSLCNFEVKLHRPKDFMVFFSWL